MDLLPGTLYVYMHNIQNDTKCIYVYTDIYIYTPIAYIFTSKSCTAEAGKTGAVLVIPHLWDCKGC